MIRFGELFLIDRSLGLYWPGPGVIPIFTSKLSLLLIGIVMLIKGFSSFGLYDPGPGVSCISDLLCLNLYSVPIIVVEGRYM